MNIKQITLYAVTACLFAVALASPAQEQIGEAAQSEKNSVATDNTTLFSVGSGYNNGVYFMLATVLSGIISHPQGDLPCEHGGNCGIDNLLLVNISTPGSAANIEKLKKGVLNSAFVQSNIAYWSYTATGLYAQDKPFEDLRALASLYPEMLHFVVHADSNIHTIQDLAGKRVGVGAKNTGTYINVVEILKAYGMNTAQFDAVSDDAPQAIEKFLKGDLDAIFFVAGVPTPQVQYLSEQTEIRLVPVVSSQTDGLLSHNQYYAAANIPAKAYRGISKQVPTIAVQALWVVTEKSVDDKLAYELTKALWRDDHAFWLHQMLPDAALSVDHSLDGIGIPLHSGAKRFYNEIGKRF